ncbi:hypothetical protein ACET3Z_018550 [Daucus carota]
MVKNAKTKRRSHKHPRPSNPPAVEDKKPTIVKTLPASLILEILCRTPVKSLVRFKCVSKSWLALLNHPTFIHMHLRFNTISRNTQLICNCNHFIALLSFSQPPIPVLNINRNFTTRPNYPRRINFPDFSKNMVIAGSINGVVCLTHYKEMLGRYVALWNPAINQWNPIELGRSRSWQNVSVGFGFDAVTCDYKIICIVPVYYTVPVSAVSFDMFIGWSSVEIYSANLGSWVNVPRRRTIPFSPYAYSQHCNFIVRGVPYWAGIDAGESATPRPLEVLGRIDPCTGSYMKVLYPQHIKNMSTRVHPVNLRGSVAALIHSPGEHPNQMVDLHVLDESTAKWTKLYTIGPLIFENLQIPQCFSTGELVLESWRGGINCVSDLLSNFCDPKTNLVLPNKEIEVLHPFWGDSYSHVESLVCVKGMVQIGKEHNDKKTKSKTRNWTEFLSKEFESALHL